MNPLRTKLLRQTILTALKHAEGYAVPEASLRPHVDGLLRPPVTDAEWKPTIEWLIDERMIAAVESDFDKTLVQWVITERGRSLLATL